METNVVLTRLKVFWFSKDNSTGQKKGNRRIDWQKMTWEDNKRWARMDFASPAGAPENRKTWKGNICGAPTISKVMK